MRIIVICECAWKLANQTVQMTQLLIMITELHYTTIRFTNAAWSVVAIEVLILNCVCFKMTSTIQTKQAKHIRDSVDMQELDVCACIALGIISCIPLINDFSRVAFDALIALIDKVYAI